ncbi:MAG: TRAP transporter small permease [Spirochaetes bacterium]|nr:TRAP transporter small permease [Spirochaetota bacterium]
MTNTNNTIIKIESGITMILKIISIFMFVLLMTMTTANIIVRFIPIFSLHWLDEILELAFAYLIFYGSAAAWISHEHFKVGDWISGRLKTDKQRKIYKLILELLSLTFLAILFYYSLSLTVESEEVTSYFEIPKSIVYSCMPVSSGIMLLFTIKNMIILLFSDKSI